MSGTVFEESVRWESDPLTTPNAQAGSPPAPQPVVQALTRAAIFLVGTINPGSANGSAVRSLCGNLPALLRSVGFRDIEGNLSCVMGIGSDAWDRLFGQPRPSELHPFREIKAGSRHAIATPGDLLFHIRAKRMDLCFELATQIMSRLGEAVSLVDEVHGFRYFDDRDLIGFVDGTENPSGQTALDAAYVGMEDAAFAGGSYVIVQKYLHDLPGWNALSTEAQERIIGRAKLSDIELDDAVKPTSAHNALTTVVEDGKEVKILRDNMPFGSIAQVNSAPILSATPVRHVRSSKCWKICLSAVRPATTIVCWISASPRPAICFSRHPRLSWKMSRIALRQPNRPFSTQPPLLRHRRYRHGVDRSVSVPSKEIPPHE